MTHTVYKESFFKIDIRNQKLKTNIQELEHISLQQLRCTLLIFKKNVHKIKSSISEFRSHFFSEVSQAIDLKTEMTSRTQILIAKSLKLIPRSQFQEVNSKKSIPRSQVVRIIDGDDELNNIAGRIPEATRSVKT